MSHSIPNLSLNNIEEILGFIHPHFKHIIFKGDKEYFTDKCSLLLIFAAELEDYFSDILKSERFRNHVGRLACQYNFPKTLNFCINNHLMTNTMLPTSASKGNLAFVNIICKTTVEGNPDWWKNSDASAYAASENNLDCLKLLHSFGNPWDEETTSFAGYKGSFDCLKYSIENKCKTDEFLMKRTAISGSIKCLQFCLDNNIPMTVGVMGTAAKFGHKQCIELLLKYNCPWNHEEFYEMVENGHSEILQLILSKIPLFETTSEIQNNMLISATLKPNHSCLLILLDYGYAPNEEVIYYAATFGNLEYLKLLYIRNAPQPMYCNAMIEAIRNGHYHCVKWLHEHHFHVEQDIQYTYYAAKSRDLPTLKYVKDKNIGSFSKEECLQGYHDAIDVTDTYRYTTFFWNRRILAYPRNKPSPDMLDWINNLE